MRTARGGLSRRDRLPEIDAGAQYQQNFSDRPGVFPSVRLTPKLFDDNRARIAKAESALRQAELEADRVRQVAIAETRRAWVTLHAERDVVRAYRDDIVALADSSLDLAQRAFDAGAIDLTVLLEAQRQLNDARIALADRELAVATQWIELERAAGGSLDTDAGRASILSSRRRSDGPERKDAAP